jgi:hypothetical protein
MKVMTLSEAYEKQFSSSAPASKKQIPERQGEVLLLRG